MVTWHLSLESPFNSLLSSTAIDQSQQHPLRLSSCTSILLVHFFSMSARAFPMCLFRLFFTLVATHFFAFSFSDFHFRLTSFLEKCLADHTRPPEVSVASEAPFSLFSPTFSQLLPHRCSKSVSAESSSASVWFFPCTGTPALGAPET